MNLTDINFNMFRAEVETALNAIANKYGCDATLGKIKYNEDVIKAEMTFNARGDNGESGEQALFNRVCGSYGFKPEHYNKPFVLDKETYTLVGFNPKARKYHCIIQNAAGEKFTGTIQTVQAALGIIK
jgi:hypothetical protein